MIYDMLWPALCVGIVSFLIIWRKLPPSVALFAVMIKFTIPVLYFAGLFGDSWTLLDDVAYYE
jgi:hypothetical protein